MRLAFSYFQAFYDNLEMYESQFSQLRRDYAREIRGEKLIFAVDFSEMYTYLHPSANQVERVYINSYILNNLSDSFTVLPGAVGELLNDLNSIIPKNLQPNYGELLYRHPAVRSFLSGFQNNIQDEENMVKLYNEAEAEIGSMLNGVFEVVMKSQKSTSVEALVNLFQSKISPITNISQIGQLSPEDKALARLVESHLAVSKPNFTESNQIDATDFIIALLLNRIKDANEKRYISIYSQAVHLIKACRSHDNLKWENDYIIREAKYFQFRTKMQELFPSLEKRYKKVTEWEKLCKELTNGISELIDVDEQFQGNSIEAPLMLLEMYRVFEEECIIPLIVKREIGGRLVKKEDIKNLYDILINESVFVGSVDQTYDVLKEHLRTIHNSLQAFTPLEIDSLRIRKYKKSLSKWLGLFQGEDVNTN